MFHYKDHPYCFVYCRQNIAVIALSIIAVMHDDGLFIDAQMKN